MNWRRLIFGDLSPRARRIVLICVALGLVVGLLGVAAGAALGQSGRGNCAPRSFVVFQLASGFGERQIGRGMERRGGVVEIFANADRSRWSVLLTRQSGMMCMIFHGRDLEIETSIMGFSL